MPRPKSLITKRAVEISLPEDLLVRLQLYLTSGLDGKVPFGAQQAFFIERINEFFNNRTLDISAAFNAPPGSHVVRGNPETLQALANRLE